MFKSELGLSFIPLLAPSSLPSVSAGPCARANGSKMAALPPRSARSVGDIRKGSHGRAGEVPPGLLPQDKPGLSGRGRGGTGKGMEVGPLPATAHHPPSPPLASGRFQDFLRRTLAMWGVRGGGGLTPEEGHGVPRLGRPRGQNTRTGIYF